jgi:predicted signal transduction protein with EAL and GGDEF domain
LDKDQMLARLSGDEFAIIVPGLSNAMAAGRITETVLEALQAANEPETDLPIAASIGVAICPDDALDRQALLSHADTALYRAKNEGRGTYRFFEASMGAAIRDRRLLEHDLRSAISRNEFRLVYQPQSDICTNKVVGFEALRAGGTRLAAMFRLLSLFRLPKIPVPFFRSGNGCSGRRAERRRHGPNH